MTKLSINVNKIALLRNSRGRDFPSVLAFASRCLDLGAHGITLHPRQDQRHARYADVAELAALCQDRDRELNVEGYPSQEFIDVVVRAKPDQCTLVPDAATQLTSDHGWDMEADADILRPMIAALVDAGIRVSLFTDFDCKNIAAAKALGAQRIELYTEPYAASFESAAGNDILEGFKSAAQEARNASLRVNAGHDLNLRNLGRFLTIPGIDEVSIGHALVVECIELGVERVISSYLEIVDDRATREI